MHLSNQTQICDKNITILRNMPNSYTEQYQILDRKHALYPKGAPNKLNQMTATTPMASFPLPTSLVNRKVSNTITLSP